MAIRSAVFLFFSPVAFKYNKTLCVKCTFWINDLQVFILTFVQTSLKEDIL